METKVIEVETKKVNKAKIVFDRIWSTALIVFNTLWGLLMTVYCIAVLWQSSYTVQDNLCQILMSAGMLVFLNGLNYVVRKLLKNW